MHAHRQQPWRRAAVATAAIVALVAAGCGDDSDDEAGDGGSTSQESATGESSGSDLATYCDAELAIETAPEPDLDFEAATPEEQAEAIRAYATDTMRPLADDVVEAAPEEVSADVAVLDDAIDQMAETGDFAVWEQPETAAASDAVHGFDLENCGWSRLDVTATDYAFGGLPEELQAGVVSFELSNEGAEVHELTLARKNDGVTETAEELLALPEEEAMSKVTPLDGNAFAPPGDDDYFVAELEPGDYLAVCFIPTGMTSDEGPPPAEGPPHAMQGMYEEIQVR
jgi:hypothetical protein